MILYCDENISPRLPEALIENGYDARSFQSLDWLGRQDVDWLPLVGEIEDVLVLSRHRTMLDDTDELEALVANNVGIVFLTGGQQPNEIMIQLVIDSWGNWKSFTNTRPAL